MKAITSLFLFATLLIFSGCSKNDTSPTSSDSGTGNMSLHFDKVNTPSNVAVITATLTRTGYSTISSNLNLLSDTSATISLSNIAAGSWHLLIQALDQNSTVTYKGETDVTITSGNITQVTLTLQQVQSGVGGIYIYVKWSSGSTTPDKWIDYSGNPCLRTLLNDVDWRGVLAPYVLYDNGKCKMWYTDLGSIPTIGYAESSDGYSWTRTGTQPISIPWNNTVWDSGGICSGPVIIVNGMYYMYFNGSPDSYSAINTQTGLAISQDGRNWTRKSAPVLTKTDDLEKSVIATDVIKIGSTYYMYYTSLQSNTYKIGLATSADGISWTKYGSPILTASQSWEGSGVYNASVIQENGQYVMIYQNSSDGAFGKATSADGINWIKDPANPFFKISDLRYWVMVIKNSCVRKIGTKTLLYYTGKNETMTPYFISVATKQN